MSNQNNSNKEIRFEGLHEFYYTIVLNIEDENNVEKTRDKAVAALVDAITQVNKEAKGFSVGIKTNDC